MLNREDAKDRGRGRVRERGAGGDGGVVMREGHKRAKEMRLLRSVGVYSSSSSCVHL